MREELCMGVLRNSYGSIQYYDLLKSYLIFPPDVYSKLKPDFMSWTKVSPVASLPHKDFNVSVNLNIYVDPGHATTKFFKPIPNSEPYSTHPGKFHPNLWYEKDLEYLGEFKAEAFECYLLDVREVHQVCNLQQAFRTMIQLSWNTTEYDEVLNRIESNFKQ